MNRHSKKLWYAMMRWHCAAIALPCVLFFNTISHAQVIITEIMFNPAGNEDHWEWIEIKNTGAAAVNLNGWVLGDRASSYTAANISSTLGNTLVPAGGVAIIYPSSAMGANASQRFMNAWGTGFTFIPTSTFPSLNNTGGERIGLWSIHADYFVNAASEPNWSKAVVNLDIATSNGFPGVSGVGGPSIAWDGSGSVTIGSNWKVSQANVGFAHRSNFTKLPPTQINSSLDRGNPGLLPSGAQPTGLRVTEIMYNPASPAVDGLANDDFEWIEVLNRTGATINFASTNYVLDDDDGNDIAAANITSGSLANGQVGVLFNAENITLADMQTAWGSGINFLPVTNWPILNNTGDTFSLWPSFSAYSSEPTTGDGRTHTNATTTVVFDEGNSWPTSDDKSSIYWNSFANNPVFGASWSRAGTFDGGVDSWNALAMVHEAVDNPGDDIGSPGVAPASAVTLAGDYNNDHTVNAADYTVWRNKLNTMVFLPNDTTPGQVTMEDYGVWKSHYGETPPGSAAGQTNVPEPGALLCALLAFIAIGAFVRSDR